ncbi:hypothetical protein VOLCADRAFT_92352 [Volvox carteri f. nagariensis]|uniref:Fibrocystin-L n=1 Tax=Volvox carteri f. nagariensis TaxID=3068 RepID=D8TZF9_VOLCA|nr:uncharacterized protein VOLCADRAFT_92352 [Volvox carteri f. nagariensis]EFJ47175.1 hypothetical protein VOLCADRAFT_92352 [Volvox carteri f. nagariensis]|eukprot:XP_002951724.1 hypothetical protein VOLCADRAFT_92352 [Volvox carteri f. nagariensis]
MHLSSSEVVSIEGPFKSAYPYAGPPGTAVNLYGDTTWRLQYSDCPAKTWGDIDCVGSITFGDYLCRQDPSTNDTGITFKYGTQRYGSNLYILGCTLPTPDANNNQPAIGTANNLNISIHFEASMRGGMPRPLRYSYHYTTDGTPYQFQLYPEVTGLSPAVGSNAGGTLLRISGRGFPDLGLGLGDTANVSISGVPCSVVNSTYDTIFCVTGPKPAYTSLASIPANGLYPGMRGVEYEFYNMTQTISYGDLWRLNKTILLNNTSGSGSYRTILKGAMESIHYETSNHCTRLKAFFVAPRTSTYTFYLSADDYGQLNGTFVNQTGVVVTKTLIELTSYTYLDNYAMRSTQKALPLALMADQPILLETAHCNVWGSGALQVAVRMEVPKPQANSMVERQTITVSSVLVPRSLAIKYLYGAGAGTMAFTVNVISTDNSKLDSASLGLELTFNCTVGARTVVLPLLATGLDMTALIEVAFGGKYSLGSNGTSFGVYKARTPGLLTVQIGIDAGRASTLGFTVTLARLVVMPAPAPYTSVSCGGAANNQTAPTRHLLAATTDVNISTGGMVVILEQSRPVTAVIPGGFFQLRLANHADAVVLSYDTNTTIMWSAIRNLTSLDNIVAINSVRREGAFLARVWNVTFAISAFNNVPDLVVETNDRTPDGVEMGMEVHIANPPVTGTFWVAFGENCGSVEIDVTDVSEAIRLKLASLPGMAAPQSVVVSGGPAYGYTYTVYFDPIGNPGDQPMLKVTDISGLSGIGTNASVVTDENGSTDAFYAPIPTEFLRLAVSQPGTINLQVNGVPSACADASGICGFLYSDAATPRITGVSPTRLAFSSQASLPLTITGSGFSSGPSVEVRVGTALCNVTSVTATQITCNVPDTAPAGVRLVSVNVAGLGFADGAPNVTLETLYVTGSAPSPAVLSSAGISVLNFTGKGFDYVDCANNKFSIANVSCGVVACGAHFLTVAYHGNGNADVASASVTAEVYEDSSMIDWDIPPSVQVQISQSASSISGLSPAHMPGCGGVITLSLTGTTASQVTSVFMVPFISSLLNYTEASAAYKARVACTDVTAGSSGTLTCTSPALRSGRYHTLAVLSSGLQLLSTDTILFELFITSVSPNLGSIGGGTLVTITGSGFSPLVAANAVFMAVPVSSTFLNGIIECVTESVTTTTLTCRTLPSMAANADADDPRATKVMPVATQPRLVSVVICDPGYNTTILRGYCWSLPETPRANCAASDASLCSFGYVGGALGYVHCLSPGNFLLSQAISPSRGYYGHSVNLGGTYMDDVINVQFLQDNVVKGLGSRVSAGYSGVTCLVPDLLPGVYKVLLLKANGEMSVDPYKIGIFTYHAVIAGLENDVGSLTGGLQLGITVGGAGLAESAGDNQVTIAGLTCPILSKENRTHLTCQAPGINGYVYAEYWNLGYNTNSMPDIISFTDPLVARLEKGLDLAWNGSSPVPGTIQSDYFAARFTFYYQIAQTENVTFRLDSDDESRLYVDEQLIGSCWNNLNVSLAAGVHKIVTTFVEYSGWATVKLRVMLTRADGTMGPLSTVEWQKVTPVPPGEALPVELTVSGVSSDKWCPTSTKILQLPGQPALSWEPPQVTVPYGTCGYIYSTYRTPSLSILSGITYSGIMQPTFNSTNTTLSIFGNFLTDPSLPAASQISVTLANRLCSIVGVAPVTVNGTNTTNINCTAPALPAGQWPVSIMVEGLGLTRPTATAATDLPIVTYTVRVLNYTFNNPNSKCYFSLFGGGTFNITGYGFVKDLVDTTLQVNMTAAWETVFCGSGFSNSPPCQAVNSSRLNLVPLASDGFTASFGLTRFKVPNPEAFAGNNSISGVNLRYKPRVYYTSNGTYAATAGAELLYFCGGRTPALSGVTPLSAPPDAGATLSLTWYLSGVGTLNNIITAPAAKNGASNATVEFEVGPTVLPCRNPVVTDFNITSTTYREAISCTMPAYMPAATYTLWLCIQPFGCGLLPAYTVPLTITAMSATTGGSAGGITVVITGKGFDTNTTLVSVRFGNSTCKVISSATTSLTCVTGPLDTKPVSPVTWPLSITPTAGTNETTLSSFTFTFDPALESTVSGIVPARGSTEGGTPVTITGADFRTGVSTTVSIGDVACQSVVVVNSTAITCTTGKPPNSILRVPLPVTVLQQGRGYARSSAQYQYIDVWSRNSTWGGGPLPGYEDSVVIPAGVTVLLDISPPKLYVIVLEGNLVFDDTKDYINLQAHYIIVKGGNFTIGSAEKPYPGRANITMHGMPNSLDLPQYGAKALGVRTGIVSWYGQPKIPHYTKLSQTANPGDTSIVVNGAINWQVGDRIVIASSSFLPYEVDESTITALDNTTVPSCTVISLDVPLKYTHIGEIHSQEDVARPLDMRAEVAVLTRNIVLQGDYTSAKYQYGVQVMVNTPSYLPKGVVRFDNIEITQSGQAFRLGRYSMHWHLMGDMAWQTWVRGCAIHHTYNRAITVHGTHRAIIQNVTAYHTMGHTFFLEDGIESSNLIEGTLAIYVRVSDALLNTDTTPGAFWITNPNNTVRNNVAVGSHGYGFWYRMLDYPDGPSATTTICPKFTPLLEFTNNTAHSNQFYGLRIHPEFYPRNVPCTGFSGIFQQVPAVFNGLVAYKNGVKGVVAGQVGLVQFVNMVLGDNGGGPKQHSISGKDNGASMEISWVVDDRNRYDVKLAEMAGFQNCTIYAQTSTGMQGTAGQWPSSRRITAIISQSPVQGDSKHSALMSMINMTYVDFTADKPGFSVLEACGKCKTYQGGATTFTANTTFIQSDGTKPVLSLWSWGHQGIFLDTDGTMLNAKSLPDSLLPDPFGNWTLGPGATWHSAVENDLFDPKECVYVRDMFTSNNGAYCSPALTFRRVMLHNHGPEALKYKNLNVVSLATNRTSVVHFSGYNEDGYQFTTATNRNYWLTWDMVLYRLDPEYYQLHKMDLMNGSDFVYYSSKYIQVKDHFTVNNALSNRTAVPLALPNTTHGDSFYNKTFNQNSWWWSNRTYNDTKFTIFLNGRIDGGLYVQSYTCPDTGCTDLPEVVVDVRDGTLYWSNTSTWNTSAVNNFRKPVAGDNVTIPYGWDLVIDESPPPLLALTVQGNLRFDTTRDINLTATYIIVMGQGVLSAGSATEPHPAKATIRLKGARDTPDYGIDNNLNLGSKVLAALSGGTINLYGRQVAKRWLRLGSRASPGDITITMSDPNHGWSVGDKILISSTSFSWKQSEIRTIASVLKNGSQLLLDSPLAHPHGARVKAYPGGPTVDMRAEVGLVSSNVLITADDGESTHSYNGEMFGARVVVSGNSTGRFDNIAMEYCGQGGLSNRSCIFYDRMASVKLFNKDNITNTTSQVTVPNPSFLKNSALVWGMQSNVRIGGEPEQADPVSITNNVMYEALDIHSVEVYTTQNIIRGNLVIGTIKDMSGKSVFDIAMPSSFFISNASNWVTDNVAAGAERYGYTYFGIPCGANFTTGVFRNNTAHGCLAGLWLQASSDSSREGCTVLRNFTTYMNWDFGIISTRGITTNVVLEDVNVLDNKHAGIHLMYKGGLTDNGAMWWYGGLIAGQSSDDVCSVCTTLSDPGCHPKMSIQSFNQYEPFSPAVGLQASQFAINFYDGPEKKPWDKAKSYAIVHGMFNITGVTLADFLGPGGCGGAQTGTYALANQPKAPETFYPHFFSNMNVVNVTKGPSQGMFYHTGPDPGWRGELCGEANYTREDGSVIMLTCAGPNHVHWRDLDGSLLGDVGSVSGYFQDGPRVFPMEQGTPVVPGPCTYDPILRSYGCVQGSSSFLLDAPMKPKPIPADGIWGDPQYFVLESRDKDSEDRNFGPVFFNVSGSIDLVTVQMDHGCCFTYKCQKRLSTFATYVPSGQTVYINFTGTPSQIFRLWLPYADPDKEIVVVINYLYTMNRRFVVLPGGVSNVTGRIPPEASAPTIGDGKGHGAYYWDQFNTLMHVKMTGGKHLEIRTENAVQISQSFALTVDQFYDIKELFLKNLAYAMNISMDRIYIVKVVPGTVTATIAIAPAVQDVSELTIADALDAGDPLPTVLPPAEPPVVLTDEDKINLASMGDNAPQNLTWSTLLVLRQLWALFDTYTSVVNSVAQGTPGLEGVVLGAPTAYIPSLETLEQMFPNTTIPSSTPSSPPPSSPSQGEVIPVENSGNAGSTGSNTGSNTGSTGGSGAGAGSNNGDDKAGMIAGAVLGGVFGACLIAGAVMFAIIAAQRRKAKRLRPVSPARSTGAQPESAALPELPPRRNSSQGGGSQSGVREAFTAGHSTGPGAVSERERRPTVSAELDAERPMSARAVAHISALNAPLPSAGSATCSLAAGYVAPSEPEVIRPLVSANKQPHTSSPVVLPTFPQLGSPKTANTAGDGKPDRRSSMGESVTKTPAELQRLDSLTRNSAPHKWESDMAPPVVMGRLSQSITAVRPASGAHPGSGLPETSPLDSSRTNAARPGSARPGFTLLVSDVEPSGVTIAAEQAMPFEADTQVVAGMETPVVRALETQESWRPKSRAATGSRPPSGGVPHAAAPEDQAPVQGVGGSTADLSPGFPISPPQEVYRRTSSPRQPTMMLPGGMMEFSASPSLLRSEVAAMIVAAGSNQGLDSVAAAVMQEDQQQGSPHAARTPAGLRSDSMRWQGGEQS